MKAYLVTVAAVIIGTHSVVADDEYGIVAMSRFDHDSNGEVTGKE